MERKELSFLQDLVGCLSGVEFMLFENRAQVVDAVCKQMPPSVQFGGLEQNLTAELKRIRTGCVYEIRGVFDLYYLMIFDGSCGQYLMAGPCLLEKINEMEFRAELRDYEIEPKYHEDILRYCRRFPMLPYEAFRQLGMLLGRRMLDAEENIPYQRIEHIRGARHGRPFVITDQYAETVQMRRVEERYENSAALTEAVKCGNLSLAYHFMSRMNGDADYLARNPDPLRNRKNMCIVLNTQLRCAMESAGIHPYLLDRVSNEIGLQIERLRSVGEAERYVSEILRRYCELVQDHAYADLKPFSRMAVTYIKDHLTETLTVQDTAKALLVNADYLSDRFHKEVGMTFIDFVNVQRTAQAASLLSKTTLQIQQIATLVGYNNSSYFAKQFARCYHMSPRDYRLRGRVAED